jgi:hypothetical protein
MTNSAYVFPPAGSDLMYIHTARISSSVIWPLRTQGIFSGSITLPSGRLPWRSERKKSS